MKMTFHRSNILVIYGTYFYPLDHLPLRAFIDDLPFQSKFDCFHARSSYQPGFTFLDHRHPRFPSSDHLRMQPCFLLASCWASSWPDHPTSWRLRPLAPLVPVLFWVVKQLIQPSPSTSQEWSVHNPTVCWLDLLIISSAPNYFFILSSIFPSFRQKRALAAALV